MKKTVLAFTLLAILLALSPFLGNKIVTYYVNEEIQNLKQKGITLNFKSETPGYLYTSKQYEFILSDVEAFAKYLTEYGAGMLPPYTDEFLKSIVFRLDMKYNNIPFAEPISIDIYPMYISEGIMARLSQSDNVLFKNFRQFVTRQGLLYHIDYNLLSENYRGQIKNVDYKDRNYDGSNILLTLHNAVFNGTGSFVDSESLQRDIDTLMLRTSDTSEDVGSEIKKIAESVKNQNVFETAEDVYEKSKEIFDKSKDFYDEIKVPGYVEDVKEKSHDMAQEMYDASKKMTNIFFNNKDDNEPSVIGETNTTQKPKKTFFFFGQ